MTPTPTKRSVIEISSDEDEENTLVNPRKMRRVRPKVQDSHEDPMAKIAAFSDFLKSALPTKLVPEDLAAYIYQESNARLDVAKEAGVALAEILIGADCLPTWPGMCWDPEKESLHSIIQSRLLDLEVSQELGDLLRKEIITKGNRRLEEARDLGINLRHVVIGEGLLATWPEFRGFEDVAGLVDDMDIISDQGSKSQGSATDATGDRVPENIEPEPQNEVDCGMSGTETLEISDENSFDIPSWMPYDFNLTDSTSDSDYVPDSDDDDEDLEDSVWMNNFVNPQPYCIEFDSTNVVHDVEIVGGPDGFQDVDLEIYMAQDDDDIDELPAIELAIDREAYEYYFGNEGGIDIEIPEADIGCLTELIIDVTDRAGHDDGESVYESCRTHLSPDNRPRRNSQGIEREIIVEIDGVVANGEVTSKIIEYASEDGQGTTIRETEFGFEW
ncbi:hypothetical protein PT974_04358 [Cladobotryum mycophilum]|uniref:Uncharacterized protein n=1 Tax=Cladobotryum mycophilum TaxID=491253 RepID=A0ABR0SUY0_9HYPO